MRVNNGGPKQVAANFSFSAFLFSVFAWPLFETQLFILNAGVRLHLVSSVLGCFISAIAFRRCSLSWFSYIDVDAAVEHSAPNRYHIGDVASCVALVAAGCVLALSAKPGSIALFALCAGTFSLLPWSRFAFCRRHFFISCTMLGAGAASVYLIVGGNRNPFSYMFCAWFLWLISLTDSLIAWKPGREPTTQAEPMPSGAQTSKHISGPQLDNLVEH